MTKKLIAFALALIVIAYFIFIKNGGIIILTSSQRQEVKYDASEANNFNPLHRLKLGEGNVSIYIKISRNDMRELPEYFPAHSVLKTTNKKVISEVIKNFELKITGGDMATVESKIYIVKDGEIVFLSGIILSEDISGLQNGEYGWAEFQNQNLLSVISKFDRAFYPVIFL